MEPLRILFLLLSLAPPKSVNLLKMQLRTRKIVPPKQQSQCSIQRTLVTSSLRATVSARSPSDAMMSEDQPAAQSVDGVIISSASALSEKGVIADEDGEMNSAESQHQGKVVNDTSIMQVSPSVSREYIHIHDLGERVANIVDSIPTVAHHQVSAQKLGALFILICLSKPHTQDCLPLARISPHKRRRF